MQDERAFCYYNENDPRSAAWLRQLIADGLLPEGEVDERDIRDVVPSELSGYRQCHFFAGIGGWAYALKLAGWPNDRPVWTGSCPCQPFSQAGQGAGFADERHLWPAWFHLIEQCRPERIYGEQVASALGWLDLVFDDLEGAGYACRAEDLCAAGIGAPHIRQRLFWMADAKCDGSGSRRPSGEARWEEVEPDRHGADCRLADANGGKRERIAGGEGRERDRPQAGREQSDGGSAGGGASGRPSPLDSFWHDADWLGCRDGRWRPVEPGTSPLAHGLSDSLANVLSICGVAAERVSRYAERTKADPGETVRMVRSHLYQGQGGEAQRPGMCGELHAPPVLFDFMLNQASACDGAADSSGIKKAGKDAVAGALRIMRVDGGHVQPSHRWKPDEQRCDQPANSLRELSLVLARDTQAFGEAVLAAHAALNRVSLLRGYGNAIVPQLAAEFVLTHTAE